MKRYAVVSADCPWAYSDRRPDHGGAEAHYPTMSVAELERLPVADLALPDCALFMWATGPLLREALRVMRAWEFTYKGLAFVWVKQGDSGKLAVGNGYYTRANGELVLLGTRGSPEVVDHSVQQIVIAPRGEHSAKPPEVRRRIEKLMGDVPRVELFAREAAKGWDTWGNEAPNPTLELVRRAR